jgi:Arc-like DNA binding domain
MPRRTPTEIVQLKLRLRGELHAKLDREAKQNERSLNSEIIHRLEQSFVVEDQTQLIKVAARTSVGESIAKMQEMLEHLPKEMRGKPRK